MLFKLFKLLYQNLMWENPRAGCLAASWQGWTPSNIVVRGEDSEEESSESSGRRQQGEMRWGEKFIREEMRKIRRDETEND